MEVVSGLGLVFLGLFVAQVALKTPAPRGLAACRGAGSSGKDGWGDQGMSSACSVARWRSLRMLRACN